ncbi:carbohydrate kinase family protein [Shimia sediminis]|uniref:carbohydrate kinase family protein n=1 Tax=Shimia sediminis TaxID=2497945 RepID=UPI001F207DF8|nr:carbohydrate kinase [Shimia sediminis]
MDRAENMILCCGEAVIDMLPETSPDGARLFRQVRGGAAVNCAVALARLGQDVGFFGGLSTDPFGRFLEEEMRAEGIDLSRITPVVAPSTLAFIHPGDGTQDFTFLDEGSAGRSLSAMTLPDLEGVQAGVFGGISLIHPPGAGAFEALMQAMGPERLVLFDPNIRPALIGDQAETYRARLARVLPLADIVKLSDEDSAWLHPDPPEQLLQGRASLVMHSHGADGVTLYSRHGQQHLPASPVAVVDTVGAGDTFNAGVLAGLAAENLLSPAALARADAGALNRAAAFGIRAATFSVTRPGANPPTRKELACAP